MGPNEEQVLFYYEIGMAISQWAHVEMALRDVVINCASGNGRRTLSIGFYSIENFRSKLQFCDNLLAEGFDTSPELTNWHGLRKRLDKASSKRNRLAHRSTITYLAGKPGRRQALVEPLDEQFTAHSKKPRFVSKSGPPPGALGLLDIVHSRYEFFELNLELSNLAARLGGRQEPYANFPTPKFPTLREYRSQMSGLLRAATLVVPGDAL